MPESPRNIYALWTLGTALAAAYTMIRLADGLHGPVVADKITPLEPLEMILFATLGDFTGIHMVIVMPENRRDVDAVRTRHAIAAGGTRHGRVVLHEVRHLHQERFLLVIKRLEMRKRLHMLDQRVHGRHPAQHRENIRIRTTEPERP